MREHESAFVFTQLLKDSIMRTLTMLSTLFDSWTSPNPLSSDTDWAFSSGHASRSLLDDYAVNPTNGLPMIGGMSGLDVAGNVFAMDHSHRDLDVTIPDFGVSSGFSVSFWND